MHEEYLNMRRLSKQRDFLKMVSKSLKKQIVAARSKGTNSVEMLTSPHLYGTTTSELLDANQEDLWLGFGEEATNLACKISEKENGLDLHLIQPGGPRREYNVNVHRYPEPDGVLLRFVVDWSD